MSDTWGPRRTAIEAAIKAGDQVALEREARNAADAADVAEAARASVGRKTQELRREIGEQLTQIVEQDPLLFQSWIPARRAAKGDGFDPSQTSADEEALVMAIRALEGGEHRTHKAAATHFAKECGVDEEKLLEGIREEARLRDLNPDPKKG
jgi:hypothetical protein